jgi:WD40 repeat protein
MAPAGQESILGDPVSTYDLLRELSTMSFSVSGKTISLESVNTRESLDETVRTWNILPDGGLMHPLQEDGEFTNAELLSVAFSPDATLLVTTSRDPTHMRLWRVSDGTRLRSLYSSADEVAFSPDGVLLAVPVFSGLDEYHVQLWQVSDGTILRTLKGAKNSVEVMAFSPDGTLLAGGDWHGEVYLWRVSDGVLLDTMRPHTDKVVDMAFSPDGTLLASASEDGTVELSRVGAFFARVRTLKHTEGEYVESVAFSPDGSLLASVADNQVWLWRVADGMLLQTLQGTEGWFQDVTFSADGKVLATIAWPNLGYNGYTTSVQLWRVSDNTLLRTLRIKQSERGAGVAFSPDGRYLLVANQDGLFIWPIGEK